VLEVTHERIEEKGKILSYSNIRCLECCKEKTCIMAFKRGLLITFTKTFDREKLNTKILKSLNRSPQDILKQ